MISVTIAFILFSPQDGDTALHYASRNGHLEVVKLLLQCHADVHVKGTVSNLMIGMASTELLYVPKSVLLQK